MMRHVETRHLIILIRKVNRETFTEGVAMRVINRINAVVGDRFGGRERALLVMATGAAVLL